MVYSQYGSDFDIDYNAKNGNTTIGRSKEDSQLPFPDFCLSGSDLTVAHYNTDSLSNDLDIYRRTMYYVYRGENSLSEVCLSTSENYPF